MNEELTHFQLGNRLFVRYDYAGAIREYEAHASAVPRESAKAFAQIAECYLNTNTIESPKAVVPGIALAFQGDRTRAKDYFEMALAADGSCLRALSGLADLLPEKSVERKHLLERAVAVQPTSLTLVNLGDYYRTVDRDLAKAHDTYAAAQKITPRDKTVYQKLVDVSKRMSNQTKEAFWKAERRRNNA